MQRTLLAALLLCIAGTSPSAQDPKQKPATRTTCVAVVNIGTVLNTFSGSHKFKSPLEHSLNPYKEEARKINDQIKVLEDALRANDLPPARAEDFRGRIAEGKRRLDELGREVQKIIGKRQEDNLVGIWKEIQTAINTYATQNGIDLVLGYGDPMDKELLDLFPNVNRKMQAMDLGSTVPLFVTPRAEIADGVVEFLNKQYEATKKKSPPKLPAIDLE